jgi:hypothetical protein
MNALDVMKALLALSKKEQKSIFEFWQSMQVEKTKTEKTSPAKYTQKEYDRMETVFKYAIQQKGSICERTCSLLADELGRSCKAMQRAAWTYVNDRQTWNRRANRRPPGPIVFSALPIENKKN